MDKSILRRLENIQTFADQQTPAVIVVTLTAGEQITTDSTGMIELCSQYELGSIPDIQTDNPGYAELCGAMLAVFGGGTDTQH